mmetsp:Transcript_410/g.715  ORF Transcript_410/g.715 Transcript_410/m.715 type:complete len:197 (-) Transcript_410:61-651(-)
MSGNGRQETLDALEAVMQTASSTPSKKRMHSLSETGVRKDAQHRDQSRPAPAILQSSPLSQGPAGTSVHHANQGGGRLEVSSSSKRRLNNADAMEDDALAGQSSEEPAHTSPVRRTGHSVIGSDKGTPGKRKRMTQLAVSMLERLPINLAQLTSQVQELRTDFEARCLKINEAVLETKMVLSTVNQLLVAEIEIGE